MPHPLFGFGLVNGTLLDNSLTGFWSVGATEDPSIPNLPLENPPGASTIAAGAGSYALAGTDATLTKAGGGGGGAPVEISFISSFGEFGGGTISGTVNIGAQADFKVIVLAVAVNASSSAITGGTLAGVSGTLYETNSAFDSANRSHSFIVWAMPTQSGSVAFSVSTSASAWQYNLQWHQVLNAEPIPNSTDGNASTSTTVTVIADGAVISTLHTFTGTPDFTGTGWTSNFNTQSGLVCRTGYNNPAAGSFNANNTSALYTATLAFEPLPGGAVAYTLAADPGSYALTGQTATLTKGKRLVPDAAGSYTLSGQAATLRRNLPVVALPGAYSISGQPANLTKSGANKVIIAEVGSYAVTGQLATTRHGWKVIATTVGAYAFSGQLATLRRGRVLQASAGAYGITGSTASLTTSGLLTYIYVGHSLVDAITQQMTLILSGDQYYQTIVGAPLSWNWDHHDEAAFDARDYCAANPITDLVLCENNTIAPHVAKPWIEVWRNNALAVSPNVRTWWYQCWQTIPSGGTDFATWKTTMAAYTAAHETQIQVLYSAIGTNHPKLIPAGAALVALVEAIEDDLITGITDPADLFSDDVHPDDPGQYFVAMVHYAALTGTSPVGLSNTLGDATVTTTQAAELQALAWDFVSTYPYAGIADWPEPPSPEGEITLGTMGTDTIDVSSPNYNDCSVDFGTARAGRTLVMFFGGSSLGQLGQTCVIDPAGAAISVALLIAPMHRKPRLPKLCSTARCHPA